MNTSLLHPLHSCWDLAASAIRAQALETALALHLFEALAEPLSAVELATRKHWHAANTETLLQLLWSMDLLRRHRCAHAADRYTLEPVARQYLLTESPHFCGDAWRYRLSSLRNMAGQLRAHVEQGPQLPANGIPSANGAGWAAAARAQIGQEQQAVSAAAAMGILKGMPQLRHARRLLDLGGGAGWVAIELARQVPDLQATVFDWPETAAVAQENINASGLAERLSAQGGDLATDALGGPFDLVWCSSVLHFVPDIQAVLAKILAAMAPGALLVCVHAELSATAQDAAQVMPFYLPMRMLGRHVLPEGATAALLCEAGFSQIEQFASGQFPMAPVQVVLACKPMTLAQPKDCHV